MAGRLLGRFVNSALSLIGTLPQSQTNGVSLWGTSDAPHLLPFLGQESSWGNRTVECSQVIRDMPESGVTRYYNLTVERQTMAPDGVEQSMIVVNGQFPGPLIEANWGDWISVTVNNEISGPGEGLSMHWHGLDQRGSPWMDGVPGISSCPIPPGGSYTYLFRADHYGTSWYHSHYSAQYTSGIVGPVVIHGPVQEGVTYDLDLGPIMVQDWYHQYYEDIITEITAGGLTSPLQAYRPLSDANLIQGKGFYPCSNVTNGASCGNAGLATFQFTPGQTHRLRFINSGSEAFQMISIDGHTMTVIANDFIPVQPYETEFVTLGVGQRTDVIVYADGGPGQSYWLRAWNSPTCGSTNAPDGRAVIFYPGADQTAVPTTTGPQVPTDSQCSNDPLSSTVPVYVEPALEPDVTVYITLTVGLNSTGSAQFFMNGVAYHGDFNDPVLPDALAGQTWFPTERNILSQGSNGTVRIIFQNTMPAAHPIHLHGHDFQVLAIGNGEWDGTINNPSNPQRRDVHVAWGGPSVASSNPTFLVLQYNQDNPGIWPFHCHIAWHVSNGMAVMLEELPDQFPTLQQQLPASAGELCSAWSDWTAGNEVTDDDSTLKRLKRRSKVTMAMSDEAFLRSLE